MKKVGNKVVVVGLGAVGVSYAYSMLNQALCDDMVLIDINRTRAFTSAITMIVRMGHRVYLRGRGAGSRRNPFGLNRQKPAHLPRHRFKSHGFRL